MPLDKKEIIPFTRFDGSNGTAIILYQINPIKLEITIDDEVFISKEGHDISVCFQILKSQIEDKGIKLFCNGSDRTFMVNGYLSQTSMGLYGVIDKSDGNSEEVYIFESNFNIDYASVSEQKQYQREYLTYYRFAGHR